MKSIKRLGFIVLAVVMGVAFTMPAWGGTPSTLKTNVWKMQQTFKHLVREWELPGLAGWVVDSSNDIDDATAPNITICDNVPCMIWDGSDEVTGIMHTERLPSNYHSGLHFYFLVSSSAQMGLPGLDLQIWVNREGQAFQTIPYTGSAVTSSLVATHTTNDVLEIIFDDSPTMQMFRAGDYVTMEIFNAGGGGGGVKTNTELKGIAATYNADR